MKLNINKIEEEKNKIIKENENKFREINKIISSNNQNKLEEIGSSFSINVIYNKIKFLKENDESNQELIKEKNKIIEEDNKKIENLENRNKELSQQINSNIEYTQKYNKLFNEIGIIKEEKDKIIKEKIELENQMNNDQKKVLELQKRFIQK